VSAEAVASGAAGGMRRTQAAARRPREGTHGMNPVWRRFMIFAVAAILILVAALICSPIELDTGRGGVKPGAQLSSGGVGDA
jgi:hypothetical protein